MDFSIHDCKLETTDLDTVHQKNIGGIGLSSADNNHQGETQPTVNQDQKTSISDLLVKSQFKTSPNSRSGRPRNELQQMDLDTYVQEIFSRISKPEQERKPSQISDRTVTTKTVNSKVRKLNSLECPQEAGCLTAKTTAHQSAKCESRDRIQINLQKNLKVLCKIPAAFGCPYCKHRDSNKSQLLDHVRSQHPSRQVMFIVHESPKVVFQPEEKPKSEEKYSHRCQHCRKGFRNETSLTIHLNISCPKLNYPQGAKYSVVGNNLEFSVQTRAVEEKPPVTNGTFVGSDLDCVVLWTRP